MSYAEGGATGMQRNNDPSQLIIQTAGRMQTWLKLVGIISIVGGVLTALSIIGIIWAWIPIWLGVLLYQAGDRTQRALVSGDMMHIHAMMDKLRLYFMINGIIIIVAFAIMAIGFAFFGAAILELVRNIPTDAY